MNEQIHPQLTEEERTIWLARRGQEKHGQRTWKSIALEHNKPISAIYRIEKRAWRKIKGF